MISRTDGYVDDVPYVRGFTAELAPAWLDHVALLANVAPPSRGDEFSWCDLGCGQGVSASVFAATHPRGRFHGIDMMAAHVDHARRLADDAGISNATFHEADFTAAAELGLPQFDYIVSHGVYSWVGAESQQALRCFVDRQLKPGGLVYVSYNAMPGWATDIPFQRLARALGETFPGDSVARFAAAAEVIRTLGAMKVPSLASSSILTALEEQKDRFPRAYLAHEYMNAAWKPLFVTEVREAMAEIGLAPIGSATLRDNYDSFVLGGKAREMLADIADDDVRELVRDVFIDQRFRRDVFIRDGSGIDDDERRDRLLASTFALARPNGAITYEMASPAGRLNYDNEAARGVVAALAAGPTRIADIAKRTTIDPQDLLANALVLCSAHDIRPAEPDHAPVDALNRAVLRRLDGAEEIEYLALPCGTAIRLDRALLALLRDGKPLENGEFAVWRELLATLAP